MLPEQVAAYLVKKIQENDVEALKLFYDTNPQLFVPIHLIIHPILNGNKEMLMLMFENTNFKPFLYKLKFRNLVYNVIDQDDRELFEIIMHHFQPALFSFLDSNRHIVDPFNFYWALRIRDYRFIRISMKEMGVGELVDMASLVKYKRVVRMLQKEVGIQKKNIRLISREGKYFSVLFKNWRIYRFSIEDQ
ncbi:hypothetical protein CYY_008789 [Polysphondylium violaceum]|uniref:Uncharacterized protein n=1 Tax=Polysphondylium violaceum TaxID=133409 RepID=A0A8J4PMX2_9MYCE|nr:hypothetical protein CYY_008789 [Polysphondylium violaceum]